MLPKITLIGRLGADPEKATTKSSGKDYIKLNVAVSVGKDETDWYNVEAYTKQDIIMQYLTKGSRILIHGALKHNKWTDDKGQKQSKAIVLLNDFELIDGKKEGGQGNGGGQGGQYGNNQNQQYQQQYQGPPTPPPQYAQTPPPLTNQYQPPAPPQQQQYAPPAQQYQPPVQQAPPQQQYQQPAYQQPVGQPQYAPHPQQSQYPNQYPQQIQHPALDDFES